MLFHGSTGFATVKNLNGSFATRSHYKELCRRGRVLEKIRAICANGARGQISPKHTVLSGHHSLTCYGIRQDMMISRRHVQIDVSSKEVEAFQIYILKRKKKAAV